MGGRGRVGYTAGLVALTAVTLAAVLVLDAGGPKVIRLAGSGSSAGTMEDSGPADGAATDVGRSWASEHRFELTDGARFGAGEAAAWRLEPPGDLRAATADLASRLDLDAGVTALPQTEGYQVGAEDFSGPVLWVGPMGAWNYHDPTAAPEPAAQPTGVPTAGAARRAAESFFAGLGLPGTPRIEEAHADQWGAWVTGSIPVGGHASDLQVSLALGPNEAVTAAHGTLASPVEADRYPTVTADEAVERLAGERRWAAPGPMADPDTPVSSDDPALPPAPDPGPEPEVRTVTLVAAEPVVLLTIDTEETAWMLPGVRFIDEDGGSWQVRTIADEYLDDGGAAPGVEPEPLPVEPGTGPVPGPAPAPGTPPEDRPPGGDPGDVAPGGPTPGAEQAAQDVLGRSEEEAVRHLEREGLTVRVVMRDGEGYPVTDDLRTDRVNLVVEDGLVVDAEVG